MNNSEKSDIEFVEAAINAQKRAEKIVKLENARQIGTIASYIKAAAFLTYLIFFSELRPGGSSNSGLFVCLTTLLALFLSQIMVTTFDLQIKFLKTMEALERQDNAT